MILTNSSRKPDYFSYSPVLLLFWGIFSILCIPHIPIASGFGWDGIFYGSVALDFENLIGKMDSYHSGRIFPAILIHYIMVVFKLPLTLSSALLIYKLYYLVILVISGFVWVKITSLLNIGLYNKWLGFVALFVSYPVLNWYFYYPSLTDGTIFLMALLLILQYLKPNYFLLFSITIISFFAWPTGIIMCFLIFVYENQRNIYWGQVKQGYKRYLLILLLIAPLLFLAFSLCNLSVITSLAAKLRLVSPVTIWKLEQIINVQRDVFSALANSLLIILYYITLYCLIFKDFKFIIFIKAHFKKQLLVRLLFSLVFVFLLTLLKQQLYDPNLPTVTALWGYAYPVFRDSSRYSLQFVVSHIAYWGPSVFLFIFFFKRFLTCLKQDHLPIMLGFIFTVIFSINAESRAITSFYPFIIFVLVQLIDFSLFKNKRLFFSLFLIFSLIFSKIWMPINLPSSTYPNVIIKDLDRFPMQWYFMNFGLWMNYHMYLVHAIVGLIFGICLYLTVKVNKLENSINP